MKPCFFCLLALLLTGCSNESPVRVEVYPSESVQGALAVSLSSFPVVPDMSALSETIDNHSFIGVLATHNSKQVKVLAARYPDIDNKKRVRVIIETTQPLQLIVRFDAGTDKVPRSVTKTFAPGVYDEFVTE